ncbi:MAG TPA: hypothetical protein PLI14_06495 [Bacilli bacterium]|jgi:5'-3' exonuclease|nr:hypothetical protein [Bacilli bacterium]
MNKPYLLIDGSFLCAQARYAVGFLETSSLDKTGVIFGFLSRLLYLYKLTGSNKFIFAWDTKQSFRKQVYPSYKETRTKNLTKEEYKERIKYYRCVDFLRDEILPFLGFKNNFWYPGIEADDIIAYFSFNLKGPVYIISSDQDLYQLLSKNVEMLIPSIKKGPPKKYTKNDFKVEYGIHPKKWWKVKAIVGCRSDNVSGINGIGNVYAIRFLKKELNKDSKQYKKIKENWNVVERNIELVKLPHKKTPDFSLNKDDLSFGKFKKVCNRFEFFSFLEPNRSSEWRSLFGSSKNKIKERLNR